MGFIVNSSPGAGLKFEPSATFPDAEAAARHAANLALRGMRLIKIRDTVTGDIYDERGLRALIVHAERRA